jgi:hypothetical protein
VRGREYDDELGCIALRHDKNLLSLRLQDMHMWQVRPQFCRAAGTDVNAGWQWEEDDHDARQDVCSRMRFGCLPASLARLFVFSAQPTWQKVLQNDRTGQYMNRRMGECLPPLLALVLALSLVVARVAAHKLALQEVRWAQAMDTSLLCKASRAAASSLRHSVVLTSCSVCVSPLCRAGCVQARCGGAAGPVRRRAAGAVDSVIARLDVRVRMRSLWHRDCRAPCT